MLPRLSKPFVPLLRGLTPPRAGWTAVAALLAVACVRHAPTPAPVPTPAVRVLDYRNGWFHPATGEESVARIAARYDRDAELIALINRRRAEDVPSRGTMIYIPPTNDRRQALDVLARIQGRPELVPMQPWDPSVGAASVEKASDPQLKQRVTAASTGGDASSPMPAVGLTPADPIEPSSPAPGPIARLPDDPSPRPPVTPARLVPDGRAFIWPVEGEVVTRFQGGESGRMNGVEIAAEEGTPVRAARGGRVLYAREFASYGKLVLIDHLDGMATVYGYCRELMVSENQVVEQGQPVATVGRLTQGGRPMLFFQIRRNAMPVDPLLFLAR